MSRIVILACLVSVVLGGSFVGRQHLKQRADERRTDTLRTEMDLWELQRQPAESSEPRAIRLSTTRSLARLQEFADRLEVVIDTLEGTPRSDDSGIIDYQIAGHAGARAVTRYLVAIEGERGLPSVVGLSVEAGEAGDAGFRLELAGLGPRTGEAQR